MPSQIDRASELYSAIKAFHPEIKWEESKWRAYKATHLCPPTERLWLHFAVQDITAQTEGKVRFKEIMAIMGLSELESTYYETLPQIINPKEDLEELRRQLILSGITHPEMHLLVWQIHQRGLKGNAAANAAKCSRQTFNRHLAKVYEVKNQRYRETANDTIILGSLGMYFDGKLYDQELLSIAEQTLNKQLELPEREAGWYEHYFYWLQDNLSKPHAAKLIEGWLTKFIEKQKQARKRENL